MQSALQCPIGVLASVKASRNVTDILIYGVLSPRTTTANRAQTPPTGLRPGETEEAEGQDAPAGRELRLYGIPLNSENITNAQTLTTPPASPPSEGSLKKDEPCATFLPNTRPLSPKRKRVNTLFEAATQHHRRVRRKGGEAVSQMMAGGNPRTETPGLPGRGIKKEASDLNLHDIKDFKTHGNRDTGSPDPQSLRTRERGRSISFGVNGRHSATTPLGATTSRDPSPGNDSIKSHHLSLQDRSKKLRPSLLDSFPTRSTTTPPPPITPSLAPEIAAPAGSPSKIIAENKDLLTRTILTCMRLYGYRRNTKQQRRSSSPHSRSSSFSGAEAMANTAAAATSSADDDDKYKAMYHATYRASTFALRRYLNAPPPPESTPSDSASVPRLEKEKAMMMIDEFLKLFCQEDSH